MIAIKNIYYLLLYAWDVFDESNMAFVDAEPDTDLLSLLASVLVTGIDRLLRRGLDRGYLEVTEDIAGVRGKCDLSATVKSNLLVRGKTVCQFDELSYDVLHNQILKATLGQLLCAGIDHKLRPALRTAYLRLPQVRDIQLSRRVFNSVQLHRNTRPYRLLIDVCRLLFDHLVPVEGSGAFRFRDFMRDEVQMRKLFERFLFNFFKHEQSKYTVRRTRFPWANSSGSDVDLLPTMITDITLECPGHFFVVDAKYSSSALHQPFYGSPTLRSGHLYQLFAYVSNMPKPQYTKVDGIIVYPLGTAAVDARLRLGDHGFRVCTIDLNQHWKTIRSNLLAILEFPKDENC